MNYIGGLCLVRVHNNFQSRHWVVNHHGGRPQTHKTHRGHHCMHKGNACCCILLHQCSHYCGHDSPHQKVWWRCQFQWEVCSYMWYVISSQGPGYFCKSRLWHSLLHNRAAQWCFHSLGEDVQCTSLLAGNGWGIHC